MLAGGDCINDVEVLRCGSTASVLGHRVLAPSKIGTWLRRFDFGHVRQLDRLTEHALTQAWAAGLGPGDATLVVDIDSTICEAHGYNKQGGLVRLHAGGRAAWPALLASRPRQGGRRTTARPALAPGAPWRGGGPASSSPWCRPDL